MSLFVDWIDFRSFAFVTNSLQLVVASREWVIENVPPVNLIYNSPVLAPIRDYFETVGDFKDILWQVGEEYVKTSREINMCFNSETHSDLRARGSELLDRDSTDKNEESIYTQGVIAHNRLMDLSESLSEISAQIRSNQIVSGVAEVYSGWQEQNVTKLRERARVLAAQLENLSGHARRAPRAELTAIEKTLEFFQSNPMANAPQGSLPLSAVAAITPVAVPTVAGAAGVLIKISEFLLTHFLMRGMSFPIQLLGALTNTIAALALKVLGSSGAQALNYIAAGVMRTFKQFLPRIFTFGGIFSGAISFLAAYSPIIIIAALILVILVKNGEPKQMAANICILGVMAEEVCGSFGLVEKEDENTVKAAIQKLTKKMYEASGGGSFSSVNAFVLNDEKEPVAGYDMMGGMREFTEAELATAIAPWLPHIQSGFEFD